MPISQTIAYWIDLYTCKGPDFNTWEIDSYVAYIQFPGETRLQLGWQITEDNVVYEETNVDGIATTVEVPVIKRVRGSLFIQPGFPVNQVIEQLAIYRNNIDERPPLYIDILCGGQFPSSGVPEDASAILDSAIPDEGSSGAVDIELLSSAFAEDLGASSDIVEGSSRVCAASGDPDYENACNAFCPGDDVFCSHHFFISGNVSDFGATCLTLPDALQAEDWCCIFFGVDTCSVIIADLDCDGGTGDFTAELVTCCLSTDCTLSDIPEGSSAGEVIDITSSEVAEEVLESSTAAEEVASSAAVEEVIESSAVGEALDSSAVAEGLASSAAAEEAVPSGVAEDVSSAVAEDAAAEDSSAQLGSSSSSLAEPSAVGEVSSAVVTVESSADAEEAVSSDVVAVESSADVDVAEAVSSEELSSESSAEFLGVYSICPVGSSSSKGAGLGIGAVVSSDVAASSEPALASSGAPEDAPQEGASLASSSAAEEAASSAAEEAASSAAAEPQVEESSQLQESAAAEGISSAAAEEPQPEAVKSDSSSDTGLGNECNGLPLTPGDSNPFMAEVFIGDADCVKLNYRTYTIPDQIIVRDADNNIILDTGAVSTGGAPSDPNSPIASSVIYAPDSDTITVEVVPSTNVNTLWEVEVICTGCNFGCEGTDCDNISEVVQFIDLDRATAYLNILDCQATCHPDFDAAILADTCGTFLIPELIECESSSGAQDLAAPEEGEGSGSTGLTIPPNHGNPANLCPIIAYSVGCCCGDPVQEICEIGCDETYAGQATTVEEASSALVDLGCDPGCGGYIRPVIVPDDFVTDGSKSGEPEEPSCTAGACVGLPLTAGGATPFEQDVFIGCNECIKLTYRTFQVPDRIILKDSAGDPFYDTDFVSTGWSEDGGYVETNICVPFGEDTIKVCVEPNADPGTLWEVGVSCDCDNTCFTIGPPNTHIEYEYGCCFKDDDDESTINECNDVLVPPGGADPFIRTINVGNEDCLRLRYRTFTIPDTIIISDIPGNILFSTGVVSTGGTSPNGPWAEAQVDLAGLGLNEVVLEVIPSADNNTKWEVQVLCGCPEPSGEGDGSSSQSVAGSFSSEGSAESSELGSSDQPSSGESSDLESSEVGSSEESSDLESSEVGSSEESSDVPSSELGSSAELASSELGSSGESSVEAAISSLLSSEELISSAISSLIVTSSDGLTISSIESSGLAGGSAEDESGQESGQEGSEESKIPLDCGTNGENATQSPENGTYLFDFDPTVGNGPNSNADDPDYKGCIVFRYAAGVNTYAAVLDEDGNIVNDVNGNPIEYDCVPTAAAGDIRIIENCGKAKLCIKIATSGQPDCPGPEANTQWAFKAFCAPCSLFDAYPILAQLGGCGCCDIQSNIPDGSDIIEEGSTIKLPPIIYPPDACTFCVEGAEHTTGSAAGTYTPVAAGVGAVNQIAWSGPNGTVFYDPLAGNFGQWVLQTDNDPCGAWVVDASLGDGTCPPFIGWYYSPNPTLLFNCPNPPIELTGPTFSLGVCDEDQSDQPSEGSEAPDVVPNFRYVDCVFFADGEEEGSAGSGEGSGSAVEIDITENPYCTDGPCNGLNSTSLSILLYSDPISESEIIAGIAQLEFSMLTSIAAAAGLDTSSGDYVAVCSKFVTLAYSPGSGDPSVLTVSICYEILKEAVIPTCDSRGCSGYEQRITTGIGPDPQSAYEAARLAMEMEAAIFLFECGAGKDVEYCGPEGDPFRVYVIIEYLEEPEFNEVYHYKATAVACLKCVDAPDWVGGASPSGSLSLASIAALPTPTDRDRYYATDSGILDGTFFSVGDVAEYNTASGKWVAGCQTFVDFSTVEHPTEAAANIDLDQQLSAYLNSPTGTPQCPKLILGGNQTTLCDVDRKVEPQFTIADDNQAVATYRAFARISVKCTPGEEYTPAAPACPSGCEGTQSTLTYTDYTTLGEAIEGVDYAVKQFLDVAASTCGSQKPHLCSSEVVDIVEIPGATTDDPTKFRLWLNVCWTCEEELSAPESCGGTTYRSVGHGNSYAEASSAAQAALDAQTAPAIDTNAEGCKISQFSTPVVCGETVVVGSAIPEGSSDGPAYVAQGMANVECRSVAPDLEELKPLCVSDCGGGELGAALTGVGTGTTAPAAILAAQERLATKLELAYPECGGGIGRVPCGSEFGTVPGADASYVVFVPSDGVWLASVSVCTDCG